MKQQHNIQIDHSGFHTDLNHISRLNAYKSSASCIEEKLFSIKKILSLY